MYSADAVYISHLISSDVSVCMGKKKSILFLFIFYGL